MPHRSPMIHVELESGFFEGVDGYQQTEGKRKAEVRANAFERS